MKLVFEKHEETEFFMIQTQTNYKLENNTQKQNRNSDLISRMNQQNNRLKSPLGKEINGKLPAKHDFSGGNEKKIRKRSTRHHGNKFG